MTISLHLSRLLPPHVDWTVCTDILALEALLGKLDKAEYAKRCMETLPTRLAFRLFEKGSCRTFAVALPYPVVASSVTKLLAILVNFNCRPKYLAAGGTGSCLPLILTFL